MDLTCELTCNNHTGQVEKVNGLVEKVSDVKWLLQLLIGIIITINTGFFIVLWNMNTTLTTINTKVGIYDKIFEDKIKVIKNNG